MSWLSTRAPDALKRIADPSMWILTGRAGYWRMMSGGTADTTELTKAVYKEDGVEKVGYFTRLEG